MIGDTELGNLRRLYYSLLVRLLWREPEAEWVASLAEGIKERARAAGGLNERMGEGWNLIGEFLENNEPEAVAQEFTDLFLGPFGAQVNAYESYYLIGHLFKEPLIAVRDFMGRVGLEKKPEEYAEPEDVIAFELEIMNWLVGKQLGANNSDEEEGWVLSQAEFLKKHLLIWGPACSKDIGAAEAADFYKGVAAILGGFLELERLHFHGFGPDKIETIEEARRRYGSKPAWRGTTFDPEGAGGLPGAPGS